MQNPHTAHAYQYRIINEISHRLNSLIAPHTPDINILLEIQFLFIHPVLRFTAYKSGLGHCICLLGSIRPFQSVSFHISFHQSEHHHGILSVQFHHLPYTGLPLDPYIISRTNRFDFHNRLHRGFISLSLLTFLPAFLLLAQTVHLTGYLLFHSRLVRFFHLTSEIRQILTNLTGTFLLGLCFLDRTDGVFNPGIRFLQQAAGIFLRLLQNLFPAPVQFLQFTLISGYGFLHLLLTPADILAFGFPVTLVTHNILQILVTLNIFATYNF